jgi:hypothetical protein
MSRVIVVGGYGHLGSRCVNELVEMTLSEVVVAGRSAQPAERLALAYGERVRGAYADADDARTLHQLVPEADCLLLCSGPDCLPALEVALEARVACIAAGPIGLERTSRRVLAERAWSAQVPIVLEAGAIPGLAGVVAERLVRAMPEIEVLRIASSGPWDRTPAARSAVENAREASGRARHYRDGEWSPATPSRSVQLEMPGPLGARRLRPAAAPEFDGFPEAHCVGNLVYLEPTRGPLERAMEWVMGPLPPSPFVLRAEATGPRAESAFVQVEAADPCLAAAVSLAALVQGALADRIPAGVSSPREALNPAAHLAALEKRGLRVSACIPGRDG